MQVRVRIDLDYDGTPFAGWAAQPGQDTVEARLSGALAQVLRLPPGSVRLVVAGRTDAGVHASGQVVHADLPEEAWRATVGRRHPTPGPALARRLRGVLPPTIRIRYVRAVPEGFDARFSALWRRYAYRIDDSEMGVAPLRRFDVLWRKHPLDVGAMHEAAQGLLGLHDFAAFCRRRVGATTVRTLLEYRFARQDDGLIVATVRADAFCHSMVRALIGVVLPVGEGRRAPGWPVEVLTAGQRHPGVTVAAARGLSLEEVRYPPEPELAERARQSRTARPAPQPCAGGR